MKMINILMIKIIRVIESMTIRVRRGDDRKEACAIPSKLIPENSSLLMTMNRPRRLENSPRIACRYQTVI